MNSIDLTSFIKKRSKELDDEIRHFQLKLNVNLDDELTKSKSQSTIKIVGNSSIPKINSENRNTNSSLSSHNRNPNESLVTFLAKIRLRKGLLIRCTEAYFHIPLFFYN